MKILQNNNPHKFFAPPPVKNKKSLISIIFILTLLISITGLIILTHYATAATETVGDFIIEGNSTSDWSYSANTLAILNDGTYTISMKTGVTTTTTDHIVIKSGVKADITIINVKIDVSGLAGVCAFDMTGATVNLVLSGDNTLKSGQNRAGLQVPNETSLTITGTDSDSLTAIGGSYCAGIGSGYSVGGNILICSGSVTAAGGLGGAGIGGGNGCDGGEISISGGIVTATGGSGYNGGGSGAGIGGGRGGNGGVITISGGHVIATGGSGYSGGIGVGSVGAGIGGGAGGDGGSILIFGEDTVVTTNSARARYIGSGTGRSDSTVFVALLKGNLCTDGVELGNVVMFSADPETVSGVVMATLPEPFNSVPFSSGSINLLTGLGTDTGIKFLSVFTTLTSEEIVFTLDGYDNSPITKTGTELSTVWALVAFGKPYSTGGLTVTGASKDGWTYMGNILTITKSDTYTISMTVSGSTTATDCIVVASGVTADITLVDVSIDVSGVVGACAFEVTSGATVNLMLSGDNTLKSGSDRAGLEVPVEAVLAIAGSDVDSLTAIGGNNDNGFYVVGIGGGAGIGGGTGSAGGEISISGGIVVATGGNGCFGGGAGIGGGGRGGSGGSILISGGIVTATGGDIVEGGIAGGVIGGVGGAGAGIGGGGAGGDGGDGGAGGDGGTISISGGNVVATGGNVIVVSNMVGCGAGIGGGGAGSSGNGGAGGMISISGGNVVATGGGTGVGGAGIGGAGAGGTGIGGVGGEISISGGNIVATGSGGGAGIGGGDGGSGGVISISGDCSVTATGSYGGAGIGGGSWGSSGDILISGGNVTANGSRHNTSYVSGSAGIGDGHRGDYGGRGGEISISGGNIVATGSGVGAGIGSGYYDYGGVISISGGIVTAVGGGGAGIGGGVISISGNCSVTATGSSGGAGIGGGAGGSGGVISISGNCSVTATGSSGGTATVGGAGIGGGAGGSGGVISISGNCSVTATGGSGYYGSYGGAGIGGGSNGGAGGMISISGGNVVATGGGAGIGGAGIGGGNGGADGSILIFGEDTFVTAKKGTNALNDIGAGYNGGAGNVFVALSQGNLKGTGDANIGNVVMFSADPASIGTVTATLPEPFATTINLLNNPNTDGTSMSVLTNLGTDGILFKLTNYNDVTRTGLDLMSPAAVVDFTSEQETGLVINQNMFYQQQGPSGSTIQVDGYGFTPNNFVDLYFADVTTLPIGSATLIGVMSMVPVDVNGEFSVSVIVPTVPTEGINYGVYAVDKADVAAIRTFMVSETTNITIAESKFYPLGVAVEVTGEFFAMDVQDAKVTLTLTNVADGKIYGDIQTFDVEADGTFVVTFQLPSGNIPTGKYIITASDTNGLYAFDELHIASTIVQVDPDKDVITGTPATVKGYGFNIPDNTITANITFGGILVAEGVTHQELLDGVEVIVPSVPVGECEVVVTNNYGVTGSTIITIAKSTTLIADPENTLRDANVYINGTYFTANAGTKVNITIVNEDDEIVTDAVIDGVSMLTDAGGNTYFETMTDANGAFANSVHILAGAELGSYIVVAVDANGLAANATLNVVRLEVDISTTAPWYYQGEVVAFYIFATAKTSGTIRIFDSNDYLVVQIVITNGNGWVQMADGRYGYLLTLTQFSLNGVSVTTNTTDLPYTWAASFKVAGDVVTRQGEFDVYTRPFVMESQRIVYVLDGGVNGVGNPVSYAAVDLPLSIANPTREGYMFAGWNVTVSSGGSGGSGGSGVSGYSLAGPVLNEYMIQKLDYVIPVGTVGDVTLTAHWVELGSDDIVYVLNGGVNGVGNPVQFLSGDLPLSISDPSRVGCDFLGWTVLYSDGTALIVPTTPYEIPVGASAPVVLYANWQFKEFTVTFVDYDGSVLKVQKVIYGGFANAPPAPSRGGYDFVGWDWPLNNVRFDLVVTAQYIQEQNQFTVNIFPNQNWCVQGSSVFFYLSGSVPVDVVIAVYDPDGVPVACSEISANDNDWFYFESATSVYGFVGSAVAFPIGSDAKIGVWTWTATFSKDGDEVTRSNTFDVIARTIPTVPFEISVTTDADQYLIGDRVQFQVSGNDFATGYVTVFDPDGIRQFVSVVSINYRPSNSPSFVFSISPSIVGKVGVWTWSAFLFGAEEKSVTGSFEVKSSMPVLDSVVVTQLPSKTVYVAGEVLDLDGLFVTATYSDGNTQLISGYVSDPVVGAVLDIVGEQSVFVSYTENGITKTDSFTITIVSKGTPTVYVTNATRTAGENVTFTVSLADNPGIASYALTMLYPDSLTYVSAGMGDILTSVPDFVVNAGVVGQVTVFGGSLTTFDVSSGNVLFTITFKINDGLDDCIIDGLSLGYYRGVGYDGIEHDGQLYQYPVVVQPKLTVKGLHYGDVNRDGFVNTLDVTRLRQYVYSDVYLPDDFSVVNGDVNGDGNVNTLDVTRLRQYVYGTNTNPLGPEEVVEPFGGQMVMFAAAASVADPVVSVSSASGYAGDTVTLDVSLENNLGIASYAITMKYPDSLTFVSAGMGDILMSEADFVVNAGVVGQVTVFGGSLTTFDVSSGNVLFTITFKINEGVSAGVVEGLNLGYHRGVGSDGIEHNGAYEYYEIVQGTITVASIEQVTYTVTYDGAGGLGVPVDNAEYVAGVTVIVSSVEPKKDDYVFAGWLYDGVIYAGGQTFMMPAGNVELVAQWEPVVSTVTITGFVNYQSYTIPATVSLYDSDGNFVSSTETASDGSYTLSAPLGTGYTLTVTRPGYLSYTIQNLSFTDGEDQTVETINSAVLGGDIDGDGRVDGTDLTLFLSAYNARAANEEYPYTDLNGDGRVDGTDLTIFLAGYKKSNIVIDNMED